MHPQRPNELIFLPTESQKHMKRNAPPCRPRGSGGVGWRETPENAWSGAASESRSCCANQSYVLQAAEKNVILVPNEGLQKSYLSRHTSSHPNKHESGLDRARMTQLMAQVAPHINVSHTTCFDSTTCDFSNFSFCNFASKKL